MEFIKNITVKTVAIKDELKYKDTVLLKYTIEYPEFHSREYNLTIRNMNKYYKKNALDFQRYILNIMFKSAVENYENSIKNGYPVHEYEAMLVFSVTYNKHCTVSIYMDRYEYTGGAHGTTARTSQTWSMNSLKQIPLKMLFPYNPRYKYDLKDEINRQIAEQINNGSVAYFENYEELVNKTFNPKSFYLTPDALVIYFQQYDIAPYSSGIPTFYISYDNVKTPYCKR